MSRKIAIIGGGIAGLSTGCYARMNGYDTEIFEMHTAPGGVCTGWTRKGYLFDGCLHFLVGTGPTSSLHRVWQELGALCGKRVIDHDVFGHIVLPDGRALAQYADVDRLTATLKEISPRDGAALDQLANDVKMWGSLNMPFDSAPPAGLIAKLRGMWKIRAYLPIFKRFAGSLTDFAARFHSPALRWFFESINPIPDMPAMTLLMMLSTQHRREAGWPEGGSLGLARSIEKRYRDLGGAIRYGARVRKILVRDGRAVGVRLADGSEHLADEVISAADGHATLFDMLGGAHVSDELKKAYDRLPLYTPLVQVSFGVNRDLTGEPRLITYRLPAPIAMGSTSTSLLLLNTYAHDPTLAPKGRTALSVLFLSPWEQWEKLADDRSAYREEKSKVLRDATRWLEARFPGIAADIEVTDVATPLTTVRYTGNYHASYEGWRPTTATLRLRLPKRLAGLAHFSMVGQWTAPFAGLPTAATDGRIAIRELCGQDGQDFVATTRAEEEPDSRAGQRQAV